MHFSHHQEIGLLLIVLFMVGCMFPYFINKYEGD